VIGQGIAIEIGCLTGGWHNRAIDHSEANCRRKEAVFGVEIRGVVAEEHVAQAVAASQII